MPAFCRFAALRTDTVRQLQEVHRMKKRTRRRRPARRLHPLGIVLLAALVLCGSLALWTRAMDSLSESDAFSAEDDAVQPNATPVGNAQGDLILVNANVSYDPETAEDLVSVYEEKNSSYYVKDTALSVCRRVMTPLNSWMEDFEAATGCSNVNIVAGSSSMTQPYKTTAATTPPATSPSPAAASTTRALLSTLPSIWRTPVQRRISPAPATTLGWWSTPGNTALSAAILRISGT